MTLTRNNAELFMPPALRAKGKRFAPIPDLVMYYIHFNRAITDKNYKVWKCARGQCAMCENMFTLVREIKYRGRAVEENLICNECWEGTKSVEFSHGRNGRTDQERQQSNGKKRPTKGKRPLVRNKTHTDRASAG